MPAHDDAHAIELQVFALVEILASPANPTAQA
jgi:hypothetical protein